MPYTLLLFCMLIEIWKSMINRKVVFVIPEFQILDIHEVQQQYMRNA